MTKLLLTFDTWNRDESIDLSQYACPSDQSVGPVSCSQCGWLVGAATQ